MPGYLCIAYCDRFSRIFMDRILWHIRFTGVVNFCFSLLKETCRFNSCSAPQTYAEGI
jgi:hypothetical protein